MDQQLKKDKRLDLASSKFFTTAFSPKCKRLPRGDEGRSREVTNLYKLSFFVWRRKGMLFSPNRSSFFGGLCGVELACGDYEAFLKCLHKWDIYCWRAEIMHQMRLCGLKWIHFLGKRLVKYKIILPGA